jgi:hypothetical protein
MEETKFPHDPSCFMLVVTFDPEDGSNILLTSVRRFTNNTMLQRK